MTLSPKAIIILKKLGYVGKDKKVKKEKNLSEFISHLLINKFDNKDIVDEYDRFLVAKENKIISESSERIEFIKKRKDKRNKINKK